jgi:hypothetical protein
VCSNVFLRRPFPTCHHLLVTPSFLPPSSYAHVNITCLETSPTALWWKAYYRRGGFQTDLLAYLEHSSDVDGLAVVWGIGNKKASAELCAEACLQHMPKAVQGEIFRHKMGLEDISKTAPCLLAGRQNMLSITRDDSGEGEVGDDHHVVIWEG